MSKTYTPADVEKEAQQYWADHQTFTAKEDLSREKYYCLTMLPYPSGDLHVGHVRNYTLGDIISRHQYMLDKNVMQPMGWDAFGLPAENAAIKRKLPPAEWTNKNINKMRKQFKRLGFAYDWSRELSTCEPEYYRWEQWLFVQLYKKGLAYKKESLVNWDPIDQTVLANEQVVDGKGWRSGAPVERREISQWFLKITDYAQELLDDIDQLSGWPEQVRTMQRNWIGRSEGIRIHFQIERRKSTIDVFTTRADTLMGATYIAIAPRHPIAQKVAEKNKEVAKFIKQCNQTKMAEADIATQEKQGIFSGIYVLHPITKEKLPVWITNFVLMEYGTGAVMSVPAHDQRDFEFAQKYELPLKAVIKPSGKKAWDYSQAAFTDYGSLINSGEFDGLTSKKALKVIAEHLVNAELGDIHVNYRLRDWGISRQRYWGTPIPIIYCKKCGDQPVPEEDLPVVLPTDLIPDGHKSPLKTHASFYKTKCPKCGGNAKRETDTMDTFVESSWYYARYCCVDQEKKMLDDRAKYWTPVDQYIGGIEHAVLHLLYARFMHKLLRDEGLINSNEPFTRLLTQGMVLKDGAKMSKSKGNTVAPSALVNKYGADTLRLFITFAAPPEQSLEWSDGGVEGCYRFLRKLWTFCYEVEPWLKENTAKLTDCLCDIEDSKAQECYKNINQLLQQAQRDMEKLQFNTVVSACMKILNILTNIDAEGEVNRAIIAEGTSILLRLLAPITPHISHHLWRELWYGKNILDSDWPKVNVKALQTTSMQLIVQVNGKLRGKITIAVGASDDDIKACALEEENVQNHIAGKTIRKVIVVPNKLINIVVQ